MIPEPAISPQIHDWKLSLSESFRSIEDLLKFCELDVNPTDKGSEAGFPVRVTKYYASLIEKGNSQDPLLLQVLPDKQELQHHEGFNLDAVGDINAMPVPGLIHKYKNRALLTLTGACPIHCRYCFRRHFPYNNSRLDSQQSGPVMDYLKKHPEINEVVLSGGDPLMLSDQKIHTLLTSLNSIPQLRYLRIHSRLLSVLPERITGSFLQSLNAFEGRIIFVTHINHANEISAQNQQAFSLLSHQQFQLFNQSVMLKGINDNAATLIDLSYKLFDSNIIPYYLHKLDKVQGAAHFDLAPEQICNIITNLRNALPGYLVPQLVNDFSGQLSKTPVQCP